MGKEPLEPCAIYLHKVVVKINKANQDKVLESSKYNKMVAIIINSLGRKECVSQVKHSYEKGQKCQKFMASK